MQIKQFTGASIDEVLHDIRAELGEEAVILQTRRIVRGGLGGFFGREGIEVTAAEGVVEETVAANRDAAAATSAASMDRTEGPGWLVGADAPVAREPFARHLEGRLGAAIEAEDDIRVTFTEPAVGAPAAPINAYARNGAAPAERPPRPFAAGDGDRTQAIIESAREAMRVARAQAAAAGPEVDTRLRPPAFIPSSSLDATAYGLTSPEPARVEVAPLVAREEPQFDDFDDLLDEVPAPRPRRVAPVAPTIEPVAEEPDDQITFDAPAASTCGPALRSVRADLLGAGVDARYLDPLLAGFCRMGLPFLRDGDSVRDGVRAWLTERLPVSREWKAKSGPQLMAFVGQTGVGKSATVQRLALQLHQSGLAVALMVAGADPHPALANMARQLGLDLIAAHTGAELAEARDGLAGHDAILVDTPGRSHQRLDDMEELGGLLGPAKPDEVHLVLPVATSLADLGDVSRRFRLAGVNRVTLTKLDETRFLGNVVNFPLRLGKPLAYVCDGIELPGSLSLADPARIAEMLLP